MNAEQQLQAYEELLDEMWKRICTLGTLNRPIKPHASWWLSALVATNPIHCDYYVAYGWYNKMVVHLKDKEFDKANNAGRNMLDSILRVFTRIGIDKAEVDEFLRARGFSL